MKAYRYYVYIRLKVGVLRLLGVIHLEIHTLNVQPNKSREKRTEIKRKHYIVL